MHKLVTVAIPIYKRLDYLPQALKSIENQDYPNIELIVSDNGSLGKKAIAVIEKYYSRPYKFRQNSATVSASDHFNQLINAASGEYFLILCDDDELGPNYISEAVKTLEQDSRISVFIAKQEVIDEKGQVISTSEAELPELLSGKEFIELWCIKKHGYKNFMTFLCKTKQIQQSGGYPNFTRAIHSDHAMLVKLCLNDYVALNQHCVFRYRYYNASLGGAANWREQSDASKQFLRFLNSDAKILELVSQQPEGWPAAKKHLMHLVWTIYLIKLKAHQHQVSSEDWIKALTAMPFNPSFYFNLTKNFFWRSLKQLKQATSVST